MDNPFQDYSSLTNSDVYLKFPLYKAIDLKLFIDEQIVNLIRSIEHPTTPIDAYCVECKNQSTFKHKPPSGGVSLVTPPTMSIKRQAIHITRDRFFVVQLDCARDDKHKLVFDFRLGDKKLMKIGQYPSVADLEESDIKKYRKILGEDKFKELSRAIGLVSHGVGIGSFAYLRRIFEYLVEEAHLSKSKDDSNWDESAYKNAHWDGQIKMVSDYLPSFLTENKHIFSILSKGIHELSEDCFY